MTTMRLLSARVVKASSVGLMHAGTTLALLIARVVKASSEWLTHAGTDHARENVGSRKSVSVIGMGDEYGGLFANWVAVL